MQSEHCIVNESTVRRKSDNRDLTIVNDTGEWLVASDGNDFFILTTNGSRCEDDNYNPNIIIYAVKTVMNCIIFISAACTIALHLYLRNLRTEFGVLVIIVCFFVLVLYVATFIHNRYQFTHEVNDNGSICAVFVYVKGILVFFYHSTVITIFFHFTYLMYSTLKLRSKKPNFDIHLTCKYIAVIISLTTVCALIIMPYDIVVSRNAFATKNGYCAIDFEDNSEGSLFILVILLSLAIAVQLVLFAFGMILYLLVTRNSCEFKTIDFKVCLALISTSGLNTVLFLTSYFLVQSTGIPFLLSSVGTLVEQLILLIISSVKVTRAVTSNSTQ